MTHPSPDTLLMLAYHELPAAEATQTEAHLNTCAECHALFARLERARVAVQWSAARRPRPAARCAGLVTLAAAAVAAVVVLNRSGEQRQAPRWRPASVWSSTAGYFAGGTPVIEIDAQLTRLEQERYYGMPD